MTRPRPWPKDPAPDPLQITILSIGNRMPAWIDTGTSEYLQRMPPDFAVGLRELGAEKRYKSSVTQQILEREAQRIRAAIPAQSLVIALDEHGKQHNTHTLAERLASWQHEGQHPVFIIGGADGLDNSILKQAHEVWSLSNYTMPHALARIFLAEQLYRAWSIIKGHPYHRE